MYSQFWGFSFLRGEIMAAEDLHLKLTMMLLFANIFLTLAAPNTVLAGNYFYEYDSDSGKYATAGDITDTVAAVDDGKDTLISDIGLIDIINLLWEFIGLLIRLFFACLIVAFQLPGVVSLLVGVPLVIAYGLAVVGWIK